MIRVALLLLVAFVVAALVIGRPRPQPKPQASWREWERVDSV